MTIFRLRDCVITGLEAERRTHQRDEVDVTQLPSRAELDHVRRERRHRRRRTVSRLIDTAVMIGLICFGFWLTYQGVIWGW